MQSCPSTGSGALADAVTTIDRQGHTRDEIRSRRAQEQDRPDQIVGRAPALERPRSAERPRAPALLVRSLALVTRTRIRLPARARTQPIKPSANGIPSVFGIGCGIPNDHYRFSVIGQTTARSPQNRRLSQPALAERVGRNRARISELERDHANNRLGRARLTLFAEFCDLLDLVPMLVPKSRMENVRPLFDDIPFPSHSTEVQKAFDELPRRR